MLISVSSDTDIPAENVAALATRLGLPLYEASARVDYLLYLTADGMELQAPRYSGMRPLRVDFNAGSNQHRRLYGGGKGQAIAKAIGLKKLVAPTVLDVTAGLGRDAFVLATLGCHVTLLERSPIVHALLEDGIKRAQLSTDQALGEIIQRMNLLHADAGVWKQGDTELPDVVYIDPMFPQRDKSALVKKEMRIFHDLVGRDEDSVDLISVYSNRVKHRIVVKRPARAKPLGNKSPSFSVTGKSTRFDVYLPATIRAS